MNAPFRTLRAENSMLESPRSKRALRVMLYLELMTFDVLAIFGSMILIDLIRSGGADFGLGFKIACLITPIYLCLAVQSNTFTSSAIISPRLNMSKSAMSWVLAVMATVSVLFVVKDAGDISRLTMGFGSILALAALLVVRQVFCVYAKARLDGSALNELIVADGVDVPEALRGRYFISTKEAGLSPDLSNPEMLHRFGVLLQAFDRVVVNCPIEHRQSWTLLLRGASVDGEIVTPEFDATGVLAIGRFGTYPTHIVSRGPLSTASRIQKRALDLLITIPALILMAPLLAIVAIAIKIDSPGPVLFYQDRVGRGNRLFRIMKFRSMRVDKSDSKGARSTGRDDDRITRVGRFIRRTSIDELPQFFNVLLGEMSIVGPRPHALGSLAGLELFWDIDHRYWVRHSLKPGITGLAQVRGFRGATERRDDLINRLRADLEYVDNWSLTRELMIMASTFRVVMHHNAY